MDPLVRVVGISKTREKKSISSHVLFGSNFLKMCVAAALKASHQKIPFVTVTFAFCINLIVYLKY